MKSNLFCEAKGLYLRSHSIGLLPLSSQEHFNQQYFSPWEQVEDNIWGSWLACIKNFRQNIATLLNTKVENICPQTNLSSALTKILTSLPPAPSTKNTVILSEEDFPSMGFVLEKILGSSFHIQYLPSDAKVDDETFWEQHLADNVYLVLLTHVQSNNGKCLPIETITKCARQNSIYSIVDVAQSAGVIPIDAQRWHADFIIGSCVKWLCGGPGAGFLYVDKTLIDQLKPQDIGWFSHENPIEFDIHHFCYSQDALKFWGGTPSVAPFVVAANSVKTLTDIGIDTIYEHNRQCKERLLSFIPPEYLVSPNAYEKQGGTLIIKHKQGLEDKLKSTKVYFDIRQHGIRLSPHIYTQIETLDDIASCFT